MRRSRRCAKLGLDRPLLVQLLDYYRQLLRGDLGTSLFTTRPVSEDLFARLPATIELTLAAMLIAVVIGIPLGVVSALWRNSPLDHVSAHSHGRRVSRLPASGWRSCCSSLLP